MNNTQYLKKSGHHHFIGNRIIVFIVSILVLFTLSFATAINSRVAAASPTDFVTTWKTNNAGTSGSTSITIPTAGTGYLYDIDWNNDGTFDQLGVTGSVTHDFGVAGTYTIRIQGDFPRINFNNGGDKEKIISVDQWGAGAWTSMKKAFYGASNLVINATDNPDLSNATNISQMFREASSLNHDVSDWDTSNITNMSQVFRDASAFNQDLSAWDISNVVEIGNLIRNTSVSTSNYDLLLASWNAQTVQSGLSTASNPATYCLSLVHQSSLTADDNWTINNSGQDCSNAVPGAPDLQASSDTGTSSTDNITTETTPSFNVQCTVAGNTITLYSNQPGVDTVIGTHTCGDFGLESFASSALGSGTHMITYTEGDGANITQHSTALSIEIDTSAPAAPVVTSPTSGIMETYPNVNATVVCQAIGDVVTISSTALSPNPTTHTCAAGGPEIIPLVISSGGKITLEVTETDPTGNSSPVTTVSFLSGSSTDSDGDGVADSVEDTAPNSGDNNGDGIADAIQTNVTSIVNAVTGEYTTMETAVGCMIATDYGVVAESSLGVADNTHEYPVGLNSFTLVCENPGDSSEITFYYDQEYDTSDWSYRKFNALGLAYSDITSSVSFGTATIGSRTVTTASYTVTDGDPATDEDGIVNGVIVDPSGPAIQQAESIEDLADTGLPVWLWIACGATLILATVTATRTKADEKL